MKPSPLFDLKTPLRIYQGNVMHHRRQPKEHRFTYPIFMTLLNLSDIESAFAPLKFWSCNTGVALASFRTQDYLSRGSQALSQQITDFLYQHTQTHYTGRIYLLTHLRYFGIHFNPISLYYCIDATTHTLDYVVAEVTNTPWLEKQLYLLTPRPHNITPYFQANARKTLHVSPFLSMGYRYHFVFNQPHEQLTFNMQVITENEQTQHPNTQLLAQLNLTHRPMTPAQLDRFILGYPWMTLSVIWRIYWQALRLACKRIPFHPHPNKRTPDIGDSE